MFENLAMYSLALEAEAQRTHSQDFQISGLDNSSKGSPVDTNVLRGHQFSGVVKEGAGKEGRLLLLL